MALSQCMQQGWRRRDKWSQENKRVLVPSMWAISPRKAKQRCLPRRSRNACSLINMRENFSLLYLDYYTARIALPSHCEAGWWNDLCIHFPTQTLPAFEGCYSWSGWWIFKYLNRISKFFGERVNTTAISSLMGFGMILARGFYDESE